MRFSISDSNLGLISRRFRDTVTYVWKHFIKNCGQTVADILLLLTTYRKSPAPYPMVPSPTPHDLPYSHNTARLAYHSAVLLFKVNQNYRYLCYLKI